MIGKFVERLFGIDKLKAKTQAAVLAAEESTKIAEAATSAAERAIEAETLAKLVLRIVLHAKANRGLLY